MKTAMSMTIMWGTKFSGRVRLTVSMPATVMSM